MIPKDRESEILRLFHAEKWPIGTIARDLGVHHSVVRRVLRTDGHEPDVKTLRPKRIDPYLPFIREVWDKHPQLCASRLYAMVTERGYLGSPDHFRHVVASLRPKPEAEAYLRLRTLPGEQAQVDWGHFGKVTIGKAERRLYGFVMVLSYSRAVFLRFFLGSDNTANFLQGHVEAFAHFGGVARTLLYDNLKSAVIERVRDAIRFNETLLAFAGHYRYEPRPVAVARGNEKGRVERTIRFIRDNFFAARQWRDLDDLNAQALAWCSGPAAERLWPDDRSLTVNEAFEQERPYLLPLPEHPFATHERHEVRAGKTPYVRFDRNDYSIPHTHVRCTLTVIATQQSVRILDGSQVLAQHARSFDRGAQIEDPAHIQALIERKREARQHRGMDRLHRAVPACEALFVAAAEQGKNLGALTMGLLKLLDLYGADALHVAVGEAVAAGRLHAAAVRQILERHRYEQGAAPPLPLTLPDDPRVRDVVVRPHALDAYDALARKQEVQP